LRVSARDDQQAHQCSEQLGKSGVHGVGKMKR